MDETSRLATGKPRSSSARSNKPPVSSRSAASHGGDVRPLAEPNREGVNLRLRRAPWCGIRWSVPPRGTALPVRFHGVFVGAAPKSHRLGEV